MLKGRRRTPRTIALVACVGGVSLMFLSACRSSFARPAEPVPSAASEVFYGAWVNERLGGEFLASARDAALRAEALDPEWVAPSRFLDESVHRGALTLPERYGRYVTAAEDKDLPRGSRARASYLAGRLGGDAGDDRLARAAQLDPSLGWAWHGIGWRAFSRGDVRKAIWSGERAMDFARDPHELTHFSSALASYLAKDERNGSAQRVLAQALTAPAPIAPRSEEAVRLRAELSGLELESLSTADVRRGVRGALEVLQTSGLTLRERLTLIFALRSGPVRSGAVAEEEIAFAVLEGAESVRAADRPGSDDQSIERLMDVILPDVLAGGPEDGGLGGLTSAGVSTRAGDEFVEAFREPLGEGAALSAVEAWLVDLPAAARSEDGDFARPELRSLLSVLRAEAAAREAVPEADSISLASLERVAAALMHAGWFREARALAEGALEALANGSTARTSREEAEAFRSAARRIQSDAIRARAILSGIGALARRIDAREAFVHAGATGSSPLESVEGGRVESLAELQEEIVDLFRRYEAERLPEDTVHSPVIRYGPLGRIVHPGPRFSAEDDALGRGDEGQSVPGIAALFGAMGRFALLGLGVGQGGPDATILRLVAVEGRSGEHLGRPFRGTVFWCDGADVPGRYGRAGASISGAALHEGYYVDLAMVRLEQDRWERLRSRFGGDTAAIATAITAPGARVPERYRTEVSPALGAGDRMRLVVMGETGAGSLRPMTLAELAHVVAVHEEGHLCDRASWYPLSFGRVLKLIGFAGAHGFKGGRIGQALEERAQLVALAECDDPRLAWIDLLDAAENAGGGSVTPHAAAYRRLLGDLLERLEDEFRTGDWSGVELDPSMRWIDQLHRIPPEQLRGLAVREAAARL
ncbi:hypothetical protein Poly30_25270 [Planctomycetes bacterium Poly30]|uniref:Uncharacterized protein n=1 Tax=Saltatorellus ferox TaxID=2528018 RepID=A0A518ESD5_9BACT|nr:hypothetical protein Poly30_25270 [Planctomycetes bacterium Poly30]